MHDNYSKKQLTLRITPIMIKDSSLERVDTYKYLGVWLSTTLNWSLQVTEVCKKARRYLGMLYRKFYGHIGPDTFLLLYLTYVRPHLKYAAAVWDPHQQGQITSLENVQKFALRVCTRDWKAGYDTLLEKCKIPTLAQRRQFMKLCFMYQVVNQLPTEPIERRAMSRSLRYSSSLALHRPVCHTSAHQFSFFPHTISLWNNLPLNTQSCGSLTSFKKCLSNSYNSI